jgi:hypothetical protein
MTEGLEDIAKRIEKQGRFTRTLIVVCTIANVGVVSFITLAMYQTSPTLVFNEIFGNLDKVQLQWRVLERVASKQAAAAAANNKTATK